ncbi:MAG: hypothetical protein ACKVOH_02005 [Chlamydiales bacterium]
MTRIGKKAQRRAVSPRKHKNPQAKSGPLKDNLPKGYKPHANAVKEDLNIFIPKVK